MSTSILNNVNLIRSKVELAFKNSQCVTKFPNIVAVSKRKTVEDIIAVYDCGLRHFGENYIQELEKKSIDPKIIKHCTDIKWHFIGKIQSNKINKLIGIPNLYLIETISSSEIARSINSKLRESQNNRIKVMIQVNTSDEDVKNGVPPNKVIEVASDLINNCEMLQFTGLMTIGAFTNITEGSSNPDFLRLFECRKQVSSELGIPIEDLDLSMGMSSDFEHAIMLGSTNVRIGTSIFGERS